jgi:hypothetical protein
MAIQHAEHFTATNGSRQHQSFVVWGGILVTMSDAISC